MINNITASLHVKMYLFLLVPYQLVAVSSFLICIARAASSYGNSLLRSIWL